MIINHLQLLVSVAIQNQVLGKLQWSAQILSSCWSNLTYLVSFGSQVSWLPGCTDLVWKTTTTTTKKIYNCKEKKSLRYKYEPLKNDDKKNDKKMDVHAVIIVFHAIVLSRHATLIFAFFGRNVAWREKKRLRGKQHVQLQTRNSNLR